MEVVSNRTRRHTRDVGTTFPSAAEARTSDSSSFLAREGRGGWKSPFKSRGYQRLRESKRSPPGVTSKGTSDNEEVALQHVVFLQLMLGFPLQLFPGSSLLTSWGRIQGRRTSLRKMRRRGGRAPPGLSRTAESNRGGSRSFRDKCMRTETDSRLLDVELNLTWTWEPSWRLLDGHICLYRSVSSTKFTVFT